MDLPKIDISSLPGLDLVTGLFGTLASDGGPTVDDRIIVIMTYLYEIAPNQTLV